MYNGQPGSKEATRKFSVLCSRLALRVLCLAQRQYSLLQAANLLTPDMTSELETLQQLVHEENPELETQSPGTAGRARGDPLAQEPYLESSECNFYSVSPTVAISKAHLWPTCGLGPQMLEYGWWEN